MYIQESTIYKYGCALYSKSYSYIKIPILLILSLILGPEKHSSCISLFSELQIIYLIKAFFLCICVVYLNFILNTLNKFLCILILKIYYYSNLLDNLQKTLFSHLSLKISVPTKRRKLTSPKTYSKCSNNSADENSNSQSNNDSNTESNSSVPISNSVRHSSNPSSNSSNNKCNRDEGDDDDYNTNYEKLKSSCQVSNNKLPKGSKNEITLKLESEVRRLKYELQMYRSVEADLKSQIVHAASLEERTARTEYSQAKAEYESLKIKLESCKDRILSDKKSIELSENKLAEERKLKILAEQSLNELQEKINKENSISSSFKFNDNDENPFSDGLTCIARKKNLEQELKNLGRELTLKDAKIVANRTNNHLTNEEKFDLKDESLAELTIKLNSLNDENQRITLKLKEQEKMKQDLISAYLSSTREVAELTSELSQKDYKIVDLKNQIEVLSSYVFDPMLNHSKGASLPVNGSSPTNISLVNHHGQNSFSYLSQNGQDGFLDNTSNPFIYNDSSEYRPPTCAVPSLKSRILNSDLICSSGILNKKCNSSIKDFRVGEEDKEGISNGILDDAKTRKNSGEN